MADAVIPANKVIPIFALMTGADVVVWTPPAGKRFRLLGYALSSSVIVGAVTLKDGSGGPNIGFIPNQTLNVPNISPPMGNGILSSAVNNALCFNGVNTQILTGFLMGTEE
jgi:hypothetical protein